MSMKWGRLRDLRERIVEAPGRLLALPLGVQFGFWLVLVSGLRFSSLFEPPVWDSAMGVFPPAIYLYETHFDIQALLQEGNWWQGGPNVHSLSLFTWFIALVMTLTDSALATFAVVHLATFALFSGSILLFTRALRRHDLQPRVIVAAAAFLILMPLVSVQVGYMYTESWVMALGVAAWASWRDERPEPAVLLCVLGLAVKMTAVAIAVCIGAALVATIHRSTVRKVVALAALPTALLVQQSLEGWLDAAPKPGPFWGDGDRLMHSLLARLTLIPDVTVLVVAGLLSAAVLVALRLRREGPFAFTRGRDSRTRSELICLLMPFVFAAGIVVLMHRQVLFLPRYLLPMIPFALAGVLFLAHRFGLERYAFALLLPSCAFFVLNADGRFYPPHGGSFSIVERSHAYRDYHRLQVEAIEALEAMPETIPAYVSKEIDYMVSDPMMGYVDEEMPQVRPIYRPPHRGRSLDELPEEFLLLLTNPGHGGREIARIAREASRAPGTEVRARSFERNGFRGALYWIRRGGSEPASAGSRTGGPG